MSIEAALADLEQLASELADAGDEVGAYRIHRAVLAMRAALSAAKE